MQQYAATVCPCYCALINCHKRQLQILSDSLIHTQHFSCASLNLPAAVLGQLPQLDFSQWQTLLAVTKARTDFSLALGQFYLARVGFSGLGEQPVRGMVLLFDLYLTRLGGASELYNLSLGSAADASIC